MKNFTLAWVRISTVKCSYDGWKGRKHKSTDIKKLFYLKERTSYIGMVSSLCSACVVTAHVHKWLAVWNVLHWLCTSELILKQHILLFVCFNNRSVWEPVTFVMCHKSLSCVCKFSWYTKSLHIQIGGVSSPANWVTILFLIVFGSSLLLIQNCGS